jgi:hypothetical protein
MEKAITTTISVPPRIWQALRALAERRALEAGGRASVSGAIVALVADELARRERANAH